MTIGLLAMQGAFAAHGAVLNGLGQATREIRQPRDLDGIDAVVLPGGESTTMVMQLDRTGVAAPLGQFVASGRPVLATCAGVVLLAAAVNGGRPDQWSYGALGVTVARNAYGRQNESFETDLDVAGLDRPFHAPFIRAPRIDALDDGIEVLARHGEDPVLIRSGAVLAATFHPELANDDRVHRLWLESWD